LLATGPVSAAPVPLSAFLASPVEGSYRSENGAEVRIAPCDGDFCGTLNWIVVPKEHADMCRQDKLAFGNLMLDYKNPDPALQSRSVIGLPFVTLHPTGDPRAFNVTVYDVQNGQSYDGAASVTDGDSNLQLRFGCVANVCVATLNWPRLPDRTDGPGFTCDGGE